MGLRRRIVAPSRRSSDGKASPTGRLAQPLVVKGNAMLFSKGNSDNQFVIEALNAS